MYIQEQDGLREPIDGILGLARNSKSYLSKEIYSKDDTFFVLALRE